MLFYIFIGLGILAGLGLALHDLDGSLLFGLAVGLLGILILDYIRAREKFKTIYAYLKGHFAFLVVVVVMLVISMWAFSMKHIVTA